MTAVESWEPVQRERTYELVMRQIEERLLDGRLKVGDRLPSERELSTMLGVSRPSLREALRVLEALGIVDVQQGGARLASHPGTGFATVLKLQMALGHFTRGDLLEVRVGLETWACREAAERADDDDFRELEAILDSMDDPAITASEFNRLDAAFHVRIATSTGNALMAHLMESLRSAINRQMIEAYATLADWRQTVIGVRREHREILQALRDREPTLASTLVREHITSFYLLGHLGEPH